MEDWWIAAFFAGALLLGSLLSGIISSSYFKRADKEEIGKSRKSDTDETETLFRNGSLENADYELPKEDFFENEKTELPKSLDEAFSGLTDEESEALLDEAGLLSGKQGEE